MIVNDDICKSNGEDVLHQHFIVENCGEGIRLRANVAAMNVFYFVKMHRQMFVTCYLLHGFDYPMIRTHWLPGQFRD